MLTFYLELETECFFKKKIREFLDDVEVQSSIDLSVQSSHCCIVIMVLFENGTACSYALFT